mmetsp:Transcript_43852/g.108500  ORF Transcript_43852/g.108500 Transcript_43852/m.108500 type:complete len:242 (+) Transcript_43852:215-940(+)
MPRRALALSGSTPLPHSPRCVARGTWGLGAPIESSGRGSSLQRPRLRPRLAGVRSRPHKRVRLRCSAGRGSRFIRQPGNMCVTYRRRLKCSSGRQGHATRTRCAPCSARRLSLPPSSSTSSRATCWLLAATTAGRHRTADRRRHSSRTAGQQWARRCSSLRQLRCSAHASPLRTTTCEVRATAASMGWSRIVTASHVAHTLMPRRLDVQYWAQSSRRAVLVGCTRHRSQAPFAGACGTGVG